MRIVITGHKGQLGQALQRALAAEQILGLDLPEMGHDRSGLCSSGGWISARRCDPYRRHDQRRCL